MNQPDFESAKAAFFEGLQRQQAGDLAGAEHCYLDSLRQLPGRASTLINLAATQLQLGRPGDALRSAEQALGVEPDSIEGLLHRGTALSQLGRLDEALGCFDRLLAQDGTHAAAWSFKGELLREMRRFDASAEAHRRALAHGADPVLGGYYLAAVSGAAAPPAPPAAYVAGLFDRYADDFDHHLVEDLQYDAHLRLVRGLTKFGAAGFADALDIGCGTGLCGPLLRPLAARLEGVDLSGRMLEKARALGVYDELVQADAVEHLRATHERHDLLLACDVFIYVGALEPIFGAASRVMDRGFFCFTLETLQDDRVPFRLEPSLRYAHGAEYVRALAPAHGFEVAGMEAAPVRREQGTAVGGLYVYLRKLPGDGG